MATVPTPATFVAGEKLAAAKLNTNIRDAISFLLNPPRAYMSRASTAQSIATATYTDLVFDTENYDSDGIINFGTSATALIIQTGGVYDILGQVSVASNATGGRLARLTVNGTAIAFNNAGAMNGANSVVQVKAENVILAAGDLVRVSIWQNSGSSLNTPTTAGDRPFLTCRWVSA